MRTRAVQGLVFSVFCFATLLGQQKPATSVPSSVHEFPVVMQQSVAAGKTPVGTKVQAKLVAATLVDGTVFPRNALFSGEVIASVARTATDPSRLAIRMDSVKWKDGSAPTKIYLTAWYYPTMLDTGQNLQYGPTQSPVKTWNGAGQYPDPNSPAYKPFPSGDSDTSANTLPGTASTVMSKHPAPMKNVQTEHNADGAMAIVSDRSNIKLDKLTVYVLATSDLPPAK